MLSMSAPKKFHFIARRLLFVETHSSKGFADFRQRAMPPHAEPRSATSDGRSRFYAVQVG